MKKICYICDIKYYDHETSFVDTACFRAVMCM